MKELFEYTLRIADDSLILGQRLSELCGHGPILEEDIATTNIALDLIGQATSLLEYAAKVENNNRSADDLAFLRHGNEYKNLLLVEQENDDFAHTITRQFFFDVFRKHFYEALQNSSDATLAAIAEKSLKETKYHLKHSSEWMIRLGDGTEESHNRMQTAVDDLFKYSHELFYMDEVDQKMIEMNIGVDLTSIQRIWNQYVAEIFSEATLEIPKNDWKQMGGRNGRHGERFGYILAEMQYMQRAYPGMTW